MSAFSLPEDNESDSDHHSVDSSTTSTSHGSDSGHNQQEEQLELLLPPPVVAVPRKRQWKVTDRAPAKPRQPKAKKQVTRHSPPSPAMSDIVVVPPPVSVSTPSRQSSRASNSSQSSIRTHGICASIPLQTAYLYFANNQSWRYCVCSAFLTSKQASRQCSSCHLLMHMGADCPSRSLMQEDYCSNRCASLSSSSSPFFTEIIHLNRKAKQKINKNNPRTSPATYTVRLSNGKLNKKVKKTVFDTDANNELILQRFQQRQAPSSQWRQKRSNKPAATAAPSHMVEIVREYEHHYKVQWSQPAGNPGTTKESKRTMQSAEHKHILDAWEALQKTPESL